MFSKWRFTILMTLPVFLSLSLHGQQSKDFLNKNFPGLSKSQLSDTLIRLSEKYAEENPDTALFLAYIALDLGNSASDIKTIALASRRLAEAYFYKNEFLKAIDHYRESANAEFRLHNDSTFFFADRIADQAYCYQELGIYEKALELYQVALRIQQKLGNKEEISNILSNLGTNHFYRGQYDQAIGYFEDALEIDRLRTDSVAIAVSMNNIGMVYSRWGKHKQALEFYQEALNFTSSEARQSIRFSNIGMTFFHLKDYNKAMEYLNKALTIDTKYKQQIKIGIRKNEIGTILAAQGKFGEAIQLQEEALKIFRDADVMESQIITLADLGDIYRKTGRLEKAELCYLESAEIASKNNSLHHLSRNYKSLYEIAEIREDYKQAFRYFRLYSATNDSVFNSEKHEQIAKFEVLFETEKKEKENQLLLRDNELKQKNQRLFIAIISGLSLILILIFSLYRIKTKNLHQNQLLLKQEQELARLEIEKKDDQNRMLEDRIFAEKQINRLEHEKHLAEIEYKNVELANSTICLVNKNEILSEIKDKLKSNHKDETIHEVVQFINANTDIDQDWHKFKVSFAGVHAGFFDRLQSSFPQLTDLDVRISAYLRLNLSSREIAGLMNVTQDATNKSRQRLRKKLNLEPEADLTEFLKSV
jgi:tetratricopeptide (TPR) repeat protein